MGPELKRETRLPMQQQIAIIGAADCSPGEYETARELGRLIACPNGTLFTRRSDVQNPIRIPEFSFAGTQESG